MGVEVRTLICGECDSVYSIVENGRTRGPGSFQCLVCGQDIFLWVCDENVDYDFNLVGPNSRQDPPDKLAG